MALSREGIDLLDSRARSAPSKASPVKGRPRTNVTFRLSPEDRTMLESVAIEERTTPSELVAKIVEEFLRAR